MPDGRGHHPNSRVNLAKGSAAARGRPRRKPTRPKHRTDLIKHLASIGWQGSTETLDFQLLCDAHYDLFHGNKGSTEKSRLRDDLMKLADRMQIGHRSIGRLNAGKKGDEVVVNHRPIRKENQAAVVRMLAATGLAGPELQEGAQRAEERIKQEERDKVARLVHNQDQEEPES